MTPQDKASELIEKFKAEIPPTGRNWFDNEVEKNCALILVRQILNLYPQMNVDFNNDVVLAPNKDWHYWKQVEAAIEES